MRILFCLLLSAILFCGCSNKQGDVQPGDGSTNTGGTTGGSGSTGNPTNPSGPTHDDTIHMVAFNIQTQNVKTGVSGKTLKMEFYENVNMLLSADAYKRTSAIHLSEDISKTSLAGFDYTTVNENGQTIYNSKDDNLNNIKTKSAKDTTVNGANMVRVNMYRTITFSKTYDSAQLAADQKNLILSKTGEVVTFSSYTYYNQKNYPVTSAVAYVQYYQ